MAGESRDEDGGAPERSALNGWTRHLDRRPNTASAAAMFTFYVLGSLLLIVAVLLGFIALLLLTGDIGSGWPARLGGVAALLAATAVFVVGRRLSDDFRVQRRR